MVLGIVITGLPGEAVGQEVGLAIGERAQAVVIEDLEGNPVDLAEYVGKKPVFFQFWATWCPLCKALEPRIEALKRKHGDALEVVIVAVAVNQNKRAIQRHMNQHPVPGRMLWDTSGRATRAFMAPSTSYVIMLDRTGHVVYTGVGDDQDLDAGALKALR